MDGVLLWLRAGRTGVGGGGKGGAPFGGGLNV